MNRLKTTLLLSLLTVMMVMMGSAIGGKSGMVFAFFMAAAMNFFSYAPTPLPPTAIRSMRQSPPPKEFCES